MGWFWNCALTAGNNESRLLGVTDPDNHKSPPQPAKVEREDSRLPSTTTRYFTVFTKGANPWIRTSSRSPDSIGPTPLGVPVRITSPGKRVMLVEMKLTR